MTAENVDGLDVVDGLDGLPEGVPETGHDILNAVREWLSRFIHTSSEDDLNILTLWIAHTHFIHALRTTPRLLIDSVTPEAGKTTALEHIEALGYRPMKAAALSSPALLARIVKDDPIAVLIDEVDRNLDPKRDGVGDLLAVINVGYRAGGTRPVLVPVQGGRWDVEEHSCFAPVAMAGISPNLPDDTRSRCIRVLLMRDWDDSVEETDWELLELEASQLADLLAAWAASAEDYVRTFRPPLPEGIKGRARERWAPLKRVAATASHEWGAVADRLALAEAEELEAQREDGLVSERPAVALIRHIAAVWPDDADAIDTGRLVQLLVNAYPDQWGLGSPYGRPLNQQRLGQLLSKNYRITSSRVYISGNRVRGYPKAAFAKAMAGIGVAPLTKPAKPATTPKPSSTIPLDSEEPRF